MKTPAIVMTQLAMLAMLGCQASQPTQPTTKPVQAGAPVVGKPLAADRRAPKRTSAVEAGSRDKKPSTAAPKPTIAPARKPEVASRPGPTSVPVRIPAPTTTIQPTAETEEAGPLVLVPSQGRPGMLLPGDSFYFVMRLRKDLGEKVLVWLVHSRVPELRFGLRADVKLSIVNDRYGQMILRVPEDVPPGLYDLEVQGQEGSYVSRHSVKVVARWADRFRFVHLSNMNVGDPAAPEFDDLLVNEINLLAPEFVVCTGDFTEWGRALRDPKTWERTLKFLERIYAPTYIVCGDHDHEKTFDRYVADNPIGTFDYGDYHGILMLDHSAHRLDEEQLKWLKSDLANHRNLYGFNFIIMHNDELDVLEMLRRDVKDLPQYVRAHKLRMIITGGHVDWDRREFLDKLESVQGPNGLVYVRTHQSSTCMHNGASGVSHYRVIEVNGQQISHVYPDDNAATQVDHSIPVGRLRVFYAGPNDGRQDVAVATVQNALNQAFEDCRVWLRVAKSAGAKPSVAGGQLVRVLDGGTYWMCEIRVDLPDKGGVKVMAASTPERLPRRLPIEIALVDGRVAGSGPSTAPAVRTLTFAERQAASGIRFYHADQQLSLSLKNKSDAAQEVWPIVRLNGEVIPLDWESASGERKPLTIEPDKPVFLPMKLVLGRVSEGPHLLQVFFRSDPLSRLTMFPVTLRKAER